MTTEPSKELCYPFADRTCSDPRCSCRREKLAALKATATEPSDRDRRDAEALFNEWYKNEGATDTKLIRSIARALAAARAVPDGHVRLSDGREPKVLGALPMTADGCVFTEWSEVWHPEYPLPSPVKVHWGMAKLGARFYFKSNKNPMVNEWKDVDPSLCYSTREAAEAAAAARGGER